LRSVASPDCKICRPCVPSGRCGAIDFCSNGDEARQLLDLHQGSSSCAGSWPNVVSGVLRSPRTDPRCLRRMPTTLRTLRWLAWVRGPSHGNYWHSNLQQVFEQRSHCATPSPQLILMAGRSPSPVWACNYLLQYLPLWRLN
jgi:hypothetical protein